MFSTSQRPPLGKREQSTKTLKQEVLEAI